MGYWSIMQTVDYMDEHCDYVVPMSPDEAWNAALAALPRPGRVVCIPGDHVVDIQTIKHTPGYAAPGTVIGLILCWFVRTTRHATLTCSPSPDGAILHVRGKLDTKAATALRGLRAA